MTDKLHRRVRTCDKHLCDSVATLRIAYMYSLVILHVVRQAPQRLDHACVSHYWSAYACCRLANIVFQIVYIWSQTNAHRSTNGYPRLCVETQHMSCLASHAITSHGDCVREHRLGDQNLMMYNSCDQTLATNTANGSRLCMINMSHCHCAILV